MKKFKKILKYAIIIVFHSTLVLEVVMSYFLRKENKKKGTYLQMYESFWDKYKKQPRTKMVNSCIRQVLGLMKGVLFVM